MEPFYAEGVLSIVTGPQGTGKTTWALMLAERYLRKVPDGMVLTNIPIRPSDHWRHFWRASDMLKGIVETKRGLIILDEGGIYGSSGAGGNNYLRGQLQMFIKLMRKVNMATIWIDQVFQGSVPPALREMARYLFMKPEKFLVDLYRIESGADPQKMDRIYIDAGDLPSVKWNTYGSSAFVLDIEGGLTELYETMAASPWADNRESIAEWLSRLPGNMNVNNDMEKREREEKEGGKALPPYVHDSSAPVPARVLVWGIVQANPNVRNARIAEILKIDASTVSKYRGEMKGVKE